MVVIILIGIVGLVGTVYLFRKRGWKSWQPWFVLFIMAYLISIAVKHQGSTVESDTGVSDTEKPDAAVGFDGEYATMVSSSLNRSVASKITVSGNEWYLVASSDAENAQFDSGYIRNNTLFDKDGFSRGRIMEGYIEYQGTRYNKL